MSATAEALDATLASLAEHGAPSKPKAPAGGRRLALWLDPKKKKWLASYRTAFGFQHVEVATLGTAATKEAAEAIADELEAA